LAERKKFMQVLDQDRYDALDRIAGERGVSVQELIRVRVIPEWLSVNGFARGVKRRKRPGVKGRKGGR